MSDNTDYLDKLRIAKIYVIIQQEKSLDDFDMDCLSVIHELLDMVIGMMEFVRRI